MKLKKGDAIVVVLGKDKGRKGKIEKIFPKKNLVLVPGLNIYKKHLKKKDEKNPGGIVEVSRPLAVSQLALICPKCKLKTRVGYKISKTGKKRMCRKCQQII